MATTLATFTDNRPGNYNSYPRLDVEILPDVHHCEKCDELITYVSQKTWPYGEWVHNGPSDHSARPKLRCRYCHTEDGVKFSQEAWYDRTFCARCEGVTGYAIGD